MIDSHNTLITKRAKIIFRLNKCKMNKTILNQELIEDNDLYKRLDLDVKYISDYMFLYILIYSGNISFRLGKFSFIS